MCGIAGVWNTNGQPCDEATVLPLINALAHRGPDGSGVCLHGPVGLAHRRLAILDLSPAGKQPMHFGRYCITFNGEIYNFVELQRELQGFGHTFRTNTDTEVILAAYDQWGPDFVLKMNGMWAFAIWDSLKRQLFLSRDRFGVKPLHYLAEPKRFVFASELKSFLHLEGFTARENEEETHRQLSGIESFEDTLLHGVKFLKAGHNMLVSQAGTCMWRWWNTLDHLVDVPRKFSSQVEQFREIFFDACRLRLRSDVPVATCLSGGLDSSSILCSLAAMNRPGSSRLTNDFHRAFVATFEGTEHDELGYAKEAIEKAGADPHYRAMEPERLTCDLAQYAYDFELIGQGLLLPVWALYREIRRDGVVVTLDGLGADELLMGYAGRLRDVLLAADGLLTSPVRTFDLARTVQRQLPEDDSLTRLLCLSDSRLRVLLRSAGRLKRSVKNAPIQTAPPSASWFAPSPKLNIETEMDESEREAMKLLSPINQDLYVQFHYGINASLLRKYDRISMAHGVEVRMPFLDWRLVTYCFSLSDESKVGHGYSKRILREAMRGILPESIRKRTLKIGFQSPLAEWMNGGLGAWVSERVQTRHFLESPVVDARAIQSFVLKRPPAKKWTDNEARLLWRHLQADLWRESFFTKKPALGPQPVPKAEPETTAHPAKTSGQLLQRSA